MIKVNSVSLKINGIAVRVNRGDTILTAAQEAGIYIPTLCHCPDVSSVGVCRLCLVRIENRRRLEPACRTIAEEGMVVITDDSEIERLRQVILELILSDHDFNCLLCPKNGQCRLQELVNPVGFNEHRFNRLEHVARELPVDTSNPFFDFNPNKCVQCTICVRTCHEISGIDAIDMAYRSYDLKVSTFADKPLKESICVSCGECVERCPVGALVPKKIKHPSREVKTTCPYCGIGCGLYLGVREGNIIRARGDYESPVNKGNLCVRGRFGYSFVNSPERLSLPLIRAYDEYVKPSSVVEVTKEGRPVTLPLVKREGKFVEITWDQAIKYVASSLAHYKGEEIAAISSARCTNEENYLFQKFIRTVLKTNNIDHCARL